MGHARISLVAVLLFPSLVRSAEKPRPPVTLPPQVCLATAAEKDRTIQIRVSIPRMIPYRVTRQVPYTVEVPKETGKPEFKTKWTTRTETNYKALLSETVLVADGKEVQVSRK